MSYDQVPFTAKYNGKAEPPACPLSREALDGPLLTMCISQLCTWVGIKRSRNCTSITSSKEPSKYVQIRREHDNACRVSKASSGKIQAELHPIPKTSIPWHTVHVDITGKLSGKNDSKEYVIVFVDAFTKFVYLHHTRKIDSLP